MEIIKLPGLTYLPTQKSFTFDEHIVVDKVQQFAAQTIFKNTAGVVVEMVVDRQIMPITHMVNEHCI